MNTEVAPPKDVVDRNKPAPVVEYSACDACGSRSFFFAKVNGTMLSYCGHHATKYEVTLLSKASEVKDLRYLIAP